MLNQPESHEPAIARNQEAYELYLKGRFFLNKRGEGLPKALAYFEQSVALDSTFALAYAGIASSHILQAYYQMIPSLQGIGEGKKAAMHALQLDPKCAEANAYLGFSACFMERDWVNAQAYIEKALQLNPNYSSARGFLGSYLTLVYGRSEEGAAQARKAIENDPLTFTLYTSLAQSLMIMGRYSEALDAAQKGIELNENSNLPFTVKANVLLLMKRPEEAIRTIEAGIPTVGRTQSMLAALCEAKAEAGQQVEAHRLYQEIVDRSKKEYVAPYVLGRVAAAVGNLDEAFVNFDKAVDENNAGFQGWKYTPWDGLTYRAAFMKDPRYQKLMNRLAFP